MNSLREADVNRNNHIFTYEPRNYIEHLVAYLEKRSPTENDDFYFHGKNKEEIWTHFLSLFNHVKAAGGVVKDESGRTLFIFRNGRWDLPKGKIEAGEKTEDAALREVREECGLRNLRMVRPLVSTFHAYLLNGKRILKETSWYEMQHTGSEKPVPQREEGISKVRWVEKKDLGEVLSNTFHSVRDVMGLL